MRSMHLTIGHAAAWKLLGIAQMIVAIWERESCTCRPFMVAHQHLHLLGAQR